MTYQECIALYPNAPAVYCLEISGDMGQNSVEPPPIAIDPNWNPPTEFQMLYYTNPLHYTFVIKTILGKREYFALNVIRRELINFSSYEMGKNFFKGFNSAGQLVQPDFIVLPPAVPFGMLALASLNKNKIVRIVPGTNDIFEVTGYPPEFSYLNATPPPVYTIPEDDVDNYSAPPPRFIPDLIPEGGSSKNLTPLLIAGGLLLFILK